MMKLIYLFLVIMLMLSSLIIMHSFKHLMMIVIGLEMMVIIMILNMYVYMFMYGMEYLLIYYLIIMVCESVLSLSLIVIMLRFYSVDYMNLLNLMW